MSVNAQCSEPFLLAWDFPISFWFQENAEVAPQIAILNIRTGPKAYVDGIPVLNLQTHPSPPTAKV